MSPAGIAPADPAGSDAALCLAAYFAELARRFPGGFDPGPPADPARYRPPRGVFLIAQGAGGPVGCVALTSDGPGRGEVKRLWVAPETRGTGLGGRLMVAVEDAARALGLLHLRLDTHPSLTEAQAMYAARGWS
ncbi:MAG: GNAT family N-acetyltransferase, partial [Gemmobacter sp.]